MTTTTPVPARILTRTGDGLTGVSGGFAEYLGIDPVWVRVAIIAGSLLTFPLIPIVYVAAWLIIPSKESSNQEMTTPPPPRPSDARTPSDPADASSPTDASDAAVAMAQARAEVEAIDRVPTSGSMDR